MEILYVGQILTQGTCLQRLQVLRDLGHRATGVDTTYPSGRFARFTPAAVLRKLGYYSDPHDVNKSILRLASCNHFDVVWVDKGLQIRPATLRQLKHLLPAVKVVSYSLDDMMNPANSSVSYRGCIPLYDLHVTTKSYNARELLDLRAKRTLFVSNAYDRDTHRPIELTAEDRRRWGADVGFIGAYERDRAEQIRRLAESGVAVTVYSPSWDKQLANHENIRLVPRQIINDDYAKAIRATKINLGFLRKINRDLQTTRSTEIPACGGFLLAERTSEHKMLFEEGVEAAFFNDAAELIDKSKYYLKHESERVRTAENGRARCLRDGYSYHDQLSRILASLSD